MTLVDGRTGGSLTVPQACLDAKLWYWSETKLRWRVFDGTGWRCEGACNCCARRIS